MSNTRQIAVNKLCETIKDDTLSTEVRNDIAKNLIGFIKESDTKESELLRKLSDILGESKSMGQFVKNELDLFDGNGDAPLHYAAKYDRKGICQMLMDARADLNIKNNNGDTPLQIAAIYGRDGMVTMLMSLGADLDTQNSKGETALSLSVDNSHTNIAHTLIEAKAQINVADVYRKTALLWAVEKGLETVVNALIQKGANVNVYDVFGKTPLHYAAVGKAEILYTLIDAGAKVNDDRYVRGSVCTALNYALKHGYKENAIALLNAGAAIYQCDYNTGHDGYISVDMIVAWINARDNIDELFEFHRETSHYFGEAFYSSLLDNLIMASYKIISGVYCYNSDHLLGYLEEQNGNTKSAEKYYLKSCEKYENSPFSFKQLAKLYEKTDKLDKAVELSIVAAQKGDPFALQYMMSLAQKIIALPSQSQSEEKIKDINKKPVSYGNMQSMLMEKAFEFILKQQFNVHLNVAQWLLLADTAIAHDSFDAYVGLGFAQYAICKALECAKTETEKAEIKEIRVSVRSLIDRAKILTLTSFPHLADITETVAGYLGHSQRGKAIQATFRMFGTPYQKQVISEKIPYASLPNQEQVFVANQRRTSAVTAGDFWNAMTASQQQRLRDEFAQNQDKNNDKCTVM